MKAFILGLLMSMNISDGESKKDDYAWVLEEMNAEIAITSELQATENMIKVFDAEWNLVGEYAEERFIQNKLSLPEIRDVQESEFLFSTQGNSYHLKK